MGRHPLYCLTPGLTDTRYFVYMPDQFEGDPVPLNRSGDFDIMAWLGGKYNPTGNAHDVAHVDPIIQHSIDTMRSQYGVKKIGGVGYCFGAKYVIRFLKPGSIDAGYSAHPSFVDDEELKAIKGPYAISAAETDFIFTTELRHKTEGLLKDIGQPYQINLYAGVDHGFAVRGDPKDRRVQYAKENAFLQALQWFEEHL